MLKNNSLQAALVFVIFAFSIIVLPLSPLVVYAEDFLPPGQKNVFDKSVPRFDVSSCSSSDSTEEESGAIDLSSVVEEAGGFSASIYSSKGELVADHKGTERPAASASTLKPIIVHAAIESGRNISSSDITASLDIRSDNNAINRIIDVVGVDVLDAKISSLGYNDTKLNNKFNVSPVNGGNKTSSNDIALAIVKINKESEGKYKTAKDALASSATANGGKDYYGNDVELSKWGGTSDVSSVSVLTKDINGKKYGVSTYVNEGGAKEKVKKIISDIQNALGSSSAGSQDSSSDACCMDESTSTNLPGRNNREKIWNYLVGELGFNDKQAAGIMGNIQQESNFSPTAVNPDSGAYGFAQWFDGRKTALENFAREKGKSKSNLGVQLEFLKKELEGGYKNTVYEPIKNASTIAEATRIWLEKFEIPCMPGPACDPEMNKRLPFSQKWYNKYSGGGADSSSSSSEEASGCSGGEGSTGEFEWPLPKQHALTSCYGQRDGKLHSGIDISAPRGTAVKAADGGEVVQAGGEDPGGFGNSVIIKHSNGFYTLYAHLKDGSIYVRKGQTVSQGDKVGEVNNTGSSRGDHLHFNIQKVGNTGANESNTKDPLRHLPNDGRERSGTNCN